MCVCIYMYIYMNHFAVHQKLTRHCKSTILQFKKMKNFKKENTVIRKRGKVEKTAYYMIAFIGNVQNKQVHRDRK